MKLLPMDYEGLSVKARVEKFDAAHGNDCVLVGERDNWLLFGDGAMRQLDPYGPLEEPPEDAHKLAKYKLKFAETKLDLARDEFSMLKQNTLSQVEHSLNQADCNTPTPPPDKEVVCRLKKLQMKVNVWQKAVSEARKEVKRTIPARVKERGKNCEINRRKSQEVFDEINRISI